MLSPSYLYHATEPAEEIAERLHIDILNRIIERIMIRFKRGDNYVLTAVDKWQLETLQQAGYLLDDIQKIIAKETPYMQSEIAEAMEDAGVKALEYDDSVYREAGLKPAPLVQSPNLIDIMQRDFEATFGEWVNFTRTIASASQQAFIRACDTAYHQSITGSISSAQAVCEALEELINDGVYVEYKDDEGNVIRRDTIETATARAVRTGISQASGHITDARMEEMEWDIILVSSHIGARVNEKQDYTNHYWWQGKFYSKSGTDTRFPPYSVCGFGDVQGIHGANCRHSHGPGDGKHNPFEKFDSEENKKQYELEQRQRTLERRIRDTKREVMGWRTAMENETDPVRKAEYEAEYQRKAALLQKQNKAYNDFCESTGQKKRSERISIAMWDRKQAAQARVAAKKHGSKSAYFGYTGSEQNDSRHRNVTMLSVEEISKRGTKNMLSAYDRRREHFVLSTASASEIESNPFNTFVQDYSGISPETANAFETTIDKLSKKYYTGLTRVEVGNPKEFFGSGIFASVTPLSTVDAYTLKINPLKTKDYTALTSRIKELSDKGYCVKIPDDKLGEYIGTHEFAHTLINMKVDSYKNYVGMDVNFYKSARKEITSVYDRYIADIGNLESKRKSIESKFFLASNQSELEKIQKEFSAVKSELTSKKISNYSLENADEFMAECFADCMIGEKPSVYSKEILEIIDRYWGIK